jgi:pimeloyl-ACP methyl ester carboxylesterase
MYAERSRMHHETGAGYARPLRLKGSIGQIGDALKTFAADLDALGPQLSAISQIPSLLIWGDRDNVVELESAHQLQKALRSELAVLKGVGHLPYEEAPQQFNSILLDYLRKPISPRRLGVHGEEP